MNFENEPQPHAPKRRDISLFEGIRTFAASVGTAALLMLSVCGLIGLPLPENAAAHAVSASHITAKTETVRTVQLGGDVFGIKLFSDGVIVAALSEIYADGGLKCPASEAGIQPGDYILSVNGNNVETNAALSAVLSENERTRSRCGAARKRSRRRLLPFCARARTKRACGCGTALRASAP